MREIIPQLKALYVGLGKSGKGLLKVSAVWVLLHLWANLAFARLVMRDPTVVDNLQRVLAISFLIFTLLGLYSMHRYLRDPEGQSRWLPSFNLLLNYVGGVGGALLLASVAAVLLTFPFQLVWGLVMRVEGPDGQGFVPQDPFYIDMIRLFFLPVFLGRLILVGPLMLRGADYPFRQSWRTTKGQGLRLLALQFLMLLPLFLPLLLWSRLPRFDMGGNTVLLITVFYTMALFFLLALYARLMEDEYKRLVK